MSNKYNPYSLVEPVASATSFRGGTLIDWISQRVSGFLYNIYTTIILKGLARLYVYGPAIGNLGGWQGKSPQTICSHLTLSDEEFWLKNMDECHRIISQHFYSWVVLFEMLVYFFLIAKVTMYCAYFLFCNCCKKR